MPKTTHFCFPSHSLVPDNLPGMVKSQDGQHKCLRLSPQSFYFILVTTGLAKTHGISLPEVQKWFDSGCPGVRRRPMCEGCPLRPPDYVPPAHLLDSSDGDMENLANAGSLDGATGVKADLGEAIF